MKEINLFNWNEDKSDDLRLEKTEKFIAFDVNGYLEDLTTRTLKIIGAKENEVCEIKGKENIEMMLDRFPVSQRAFIDMKYIGPKKFVVNVYSVADLIENAKKIEFFADTNSVNQYGRFPAKIFVSSSVKPTEAYLFDNFSSFVLEGDGPKPATKEDINEVCEKLDFHYYNKVDFVDDVIAKEVYELSENVNYIVSGTFNLNLGRRANYYGGYDVSSVRKRVAALFKLTKILNKRTYVKKEESEDYKNIQKFLKSRKERKKVFEKQTNDAFNANGKDYLIFDNLENHYSFVAIFDKKAAKVYYFDKNKIGPLTRAERLSFLALLERAGLQQVYYNVYESDTSLSYITDEDFGGRILEYKKLKMFLEGGRVESIHSMGLGILNKYLEKEVDPRRALVKLFGRLNLKAKNVYDTVGLSKSQFEYFKKNSFNDVIPIKVALISEGKDFYRVKFSEHSIASYDINQVISLNELFIKYREVIRLNANSVYSIKNSRQILVSNNAGFRDSPENIFAYLRNYRGYEFAFNFFSNINDGSFLPEDFRERTIVSKRATFGMLADALNLERQIRLYIQNSENENEEVPAELLNMFDAVSKLLRTNYRDERILEQYHDALVNITTLYPINYYGRSGKVLNEVYEIEGEHKEKLKSFEYSNEEFRIISPNNTNEIISEGTILSHCVGSYAVRVKEKSTNILFLRKNEKTDVPYFTVEVSNRNQILQVYGKSNRPISSNVFEYKKLLTFINEWAEKKKLTKSFRQ